MLTIVIPEAELFDQKNNEFITIKEQTLVMEHSLVSVAKWESKWKKSFLNSKDKTWEENIDYYRCMTITKNVNPIVYRNITPVVAKQIQAYIDDSMTATTFNQKESAGRREIITAEIIYYWMVSYNIPFECQKWHLNRLLALINVCGIKASPEKKMSQQAIYAQNRELNEIRKQRLHSKG